MKPTTFNYSDYAKLQIDMERKNEYVNALIAENERLQKQLATYEDIGTVEELQRLVTDNYNLRNELCQKCGRYKEAHSGACNSCKWRAKE